MKQDAKKCQASFALLSFISLAFSQPSHKWMTRRLARVSAWGGPGAIHSLLTPCGLNATRKLPPARPMVNSLQRQNAQNNKTNGFSLFRTLSGSLTGFPGCAVALWTYPGFLIPAAGRLRIIFLDAA
ncbi:hypothetical protein HNR65_001043 [Desulfosalsimonas propionicica]|uniref:Uncharacterized protein n=1 Tax=Desulfosalsimonas propionicica TaxID=332175 RepID=A0A7W0C7R4_9BACT|nr:hypothetical protein [Desulfosalsimonas propionicica]MBA2880725.1 hypothetical protein [Desulfosalsimonas propionicica]